MKLLSNVVLFLGLLAMIAGFTTLRVPPTCYGCGTITMCLDGWSEAQQGWENCEITFDENDQIHCDVWGSYGPCGGA